MPGGVGPAGPVGPAGEQGPIGPQGLPGVAGISVDPENATTVGSDGLVFTESSAVGRSVLTADDQVAARRAIGVPLTADETAAGVTVVDTQFPVGHVYRYVTNTEPGVTDVTAGWRAFLSLGGVVDLDARVDDVFRLTGQLTVKAKTTLRMGQHCVLLRDWVGANGDFFSNSTLRNASAPTGYQLLVKPGPWVPTVTDDSIFIEGGRIRPVDGTKTGAGLYMMGTTNLTVKDTVVEWSVKNWAFIVGGINFALNGIRVEDNTEVWEDGVHVLYGSGSVKADFVQSGDDCFAVGSGWNLPVDGVDIHMGSFRSMRGFAIKVVQNREGITATGYPDPTEKIQNIRFHSGAGKAGLYRNGLAWFIATSKGLLQDITIDGVQIDGGSETHENVNPYGVRIENTSRLRLSNVTAKNARRHAFHLLNCSDVDVSGCVGHDPTQADSSQNALCIEGSTNVRVNGGSFTRSAAPPARMTGASSASFSGVLFDGIIDAAPGLVLEGTSEATVTGSMFRKAATATTAEGVRSASVGCTLRVANCIFDVQRPLLSTQQAKFARISGAQAVKQIVSGAVSMFGEDTVSVLVRAGNTVDTLTNINSGYKGQVVTLTNGEATPATNKITLKHGTGNIRNSSGVDIVLDGAVNASVTYIWNGTSWIQQSVGSDMVLLTAAQTLTAKTLTAPKIDGIYDTSGRLAIALPAAVLADSVQVDKKPRSKKSAETAEDAPQEVGSLEGEVTLQERLAANHIEVANSNAGSSPSVKAVGADANLNLDLAGKGTGTVRVSGNPVSTRVAVPGNAAATGLPGQWAADATAIYAYTGNGTTHTWVKSVAAAW
jgi:hypothetical protein